MESPFAEEAQRYIRRIRNQRKREYAAAYLSWLLRPSGRPEPLYPSDLSGMAAQSVVMALQAMQAAQTVDGNLPSTYDHLKGDYQKGTAVLTRHLVEEHGVTPRPARKGYERESLIGQHEELHGGRTWHQPYLPSSHTQDRNPSASPSHMADLPSYTRDRNPRSPKSPPFLYYVVTYGFTFAGARGSTKRIPSLQGALEEGERLSRSHDAIAVFGHAGTVADLGRGTVVASWWKGKRTSNPAQTPPGVRLDRGEVGDNPVASPAPSAATRAFRIVGWAPQVKPATRVVLGRSEDEVLSRLKRRFPGYSFAVSQSRAVNPDVDPNRYWCEMCGGEHRTTSAVGRAHNVGGLKAWIKDTWKEK